MSQTPEFTFEVLSHDSLDTVAGGIDRNTYTNFGGQAAEVGALAGGAAAGAAIGGPGGAAAGVAAGEIANRSGASKAVGQAVGGALWDAGTALGEGAYNAYRGVRGWFGAN